MLKSLAEGKFENFIHEYNDNLKNAERQCGKENMG